MEQQLISQAKNESSIKGLALWAYYMTLGWVFSPEASKFNWELTQAIFTN